MEAGYTFFYIEANVVCMIMFALMLIRSLRSVDRQERQRVFDLVLISHILYFICDCLWVLILEGTIPNTHFSVTVVNTLNALILSYLAFNWYLYVEISYKKEYVSVKRNRYLLQLPILFFTGLILFLFLVFPEHMILDGKPSGQYYILFLLVPMSYVLLAAFKSLYRATQKENYANHGQHLAYGLYPLAVSVFGVLQIIWLHAPLFCFGCTITLTYVYMLSQDDMISQDPLTGLNNRTQLRHYAAREFGRADAEENYYVMMLDLDQFKQINDEYGHAEGDRALCFAADAICTACQDNAHRPFIARYGGDEFIVVILTSDEEEVIRLRERIRSCMLDVKETKQLPYQFETSVGYAAPDERIYEFPEVVNKADRALYEDKRKRQAALRS